MKILKQNCIAGEIKVYETHKLSVEIRDGKKISMTAQCVDDRIETLKPTTRKDDIYFWTVLTSKERGVVFSLISKALGKTL